MQGVITAAPCSGTLSILPGDALAGGTVSGGDYALASCDLSDSQAVAALLKHPGLNPR